MLPSRRMGIGEIAITFDVFHRWFLKDKVKKALLAEIGPLLINAGADCDAYIRAENLDENHGETEINLLSYAAGTEENLDANITSICFSSAHLTISKLV